MKAVINSFFHFNIVDSLIIVAVSFVFYLLVKKLLLDNLRIAKVDKRINQKGKTYIAAITSLIKTAFVVITTLILLQANGVHVTSMLAGLGIASAIVGLALQDALKDFIRGLNLLSDEYFNVGDVIEVNGTKGVVTEFGLRTTKIRELITGNTISLANRNMESVSVDAGNIHLNIPFSYEIPVDRAEKLLEEALRRIGEQDHVSSARYLGLNNLSDSSMDYLIEVRGTPAEQLRIRRRALGTIMHVFEENGISVPYPQLDVHTDSQN